MEINSYLIISIVIGLLLVALGVVMYLRFRKQQYNPDYKAIFKMGAIWLPFGIIFYITSRDWLFLLLGAIFFIIGLANKKKWREPQPISSQRRKILIIMVGLTFLLVLGTILFAYLQKS